MPPADRQDRGRGRTELIERRPRRSGRRPSRTPPTSQIGKIISSTPARARTSTAAARSTSSIGKQRPPSRCRPWSAGRRRRADGAGERRLLGADPSVDGRRPGEVGGRTRPPRAPRWPRRARSRCRCPAATARASTCRTSGAAGSTRPRATLAAEGFSNIRVQLESTDRASENGRVIEQSPAAGKNTSTDDQITLVVGQFSGGGSTPRTSNSGGGNWCACRPALG